MKKPLTKKQKETLNFLQNFYKKKGYMPTLEEIGIHFHIATISAYERVRLLQKKNWISRTSGPREIILQ